MRGVLAVAVASIVAFFVSVSDESAGREIAATGMPPDAVELLVFERPDCTYCQIFRRDVLARYAQTPAATKAPLRFVDIDRVDIDALPLRYRLTVLPTVVLMQEGREVERIAGYTGPETFLRLVNRLLAETN